MQPLRRIRVFRCFTLMAEPISETPRKKIVVHSLASFWWHVIKKSFKNACEPFEHLNSICALITGVFVMMGREKIIVIAPMAVKMGL